MKSYSKVEVHDKYDRVLTGVYSTSAVEAVTVGTTKSFSYAFAPNFNILPFYLLYFHSYVYVYDDGGTAASKRFTYYQDEFWASVYVLDTVPVGDNITTSPAGLISEQVRMMPFHEYNFFDNPIRYNSRDFTIQCDLMITNYVPVGTVRASFHFTVSFGVKNVVSSKEAIPPDMIIEEIITG